MTNMNHIKITQKGAVTLLVSVMLLIAATLLVLYTTNPIVGEQRMSANEMRSKQAFEAAQAGIDITVERLRAAPNNFDFTTVATTINSAWTSSNSSYRVRFCNASLPLSSSFPAGLRCNSTSLSPWFVDSATPTCNAMPAQSTPPAPQLNPAWIVSCGWSDDGSSRKRIITHISRTRPLPSEVNNPMTAGGTVSFNGNSTVVNYFNNSTVWTGGSLANIGATGKTVIRRPGVTSNLTSQQVVDEVGNGNQVCNVNQAPNLICTTSSGVIGPDVILNDTSLSSLTPDQFFENFLGLTPPIYKSTMPNEIIAGGSAGSISAGGKVYWVEGNASIGQNIGSVNAPVVLVVDGNLTLTGSPTIIGVVFVKGNLTTSGGPLLRGAVFVTGTVNSSGTMNVIYDPDAIAGARATGQYTSSPGSWRDF